MAAGSELETIRVVLLGKTGAGKSSTGNTLLNRDPFRVARGLRSGTERCQWADAEIDSENVLLQVTDTPGVSDTHRPEDEVLKEVGKSIAVASPGPHVILMVIRFDRFTKEEFMAYETLKLLFGKEVKDYMILVFVGIDSIDEETLEMKNEAFRNEMKCASGNLLTILQEAQWRIFGISNKVSQPQKESQAAQLIRMMKDLKRQHGGQYFRNKVSEEVNTLVDPLVQKRMAQGNVTKSEAIRQTNRAIVEETESQDFFTNLFDFLNRKVLPVLKQGLELAVGVCQVVKEVKDIRGGKGCAVM